MRLPFFFPAVIDWDESTYVLMGQSILDGHVPSIEQWDDKPPLAYVLRVRADGILFPKKTTTILVLENPTGCRLFVAVELCILRRMKTLTKYPAWRELLPPVVISLLTVAAFLPALQNGFVNWDDADNLLENPNYRGLGWTQLRWMFTAFHMGHYQPLSWLSFAFDYLVWGMNPFGYHLTNLLLHAANAVLFYFIAIRLLSPAPSASSAFGEHSLRVAAGFAALLFSVHPLRVESVAWATERRDVLSGLFFLSTLLCYLKAVAGERGDFTRWRNFALAAYAASLLAKAGGITLPFALLLLDIYPLRRLRGGVKEWLGPEFQSVLREKVPFLLLALVFGAVALFAQHEAGALTTLEGYGVGARLAQALFGIAFYLWKSVLPLSLSPLYELPVPFNPWSRPFVLSGFAVLAISAGLYRFRHAWPAGLAVWIYYILLLAPVSGVAQSGPQLAADRYTYLSCLGWALLGAAGLIYGWGKLDWKRSLALSATAGLALLAFGVLTWKQTLVWRDSETLWQHVLSVSENSIFKSSFAHYNLGAIRAGRGELEEAIGYYRRSLELYPAFPKAHYDLAVALTRQGQLEQALVQYRQTLELAPDHFKAHINLGNLLAGQGQLADAIDHYREALKIEPDSANALYNLGLALLAQGDWKEAIVYFRRAVRIQPDFAEAHEKLGVALLQAGRKGEAVEHYEEAVRIIKSRRAGETGG